MGFTSNLHNMESLDEIIENANKNIKKVFLAGVAPEFRQETYIIGLKLTLDRLAREVEFVQKDDYTTYNMHYVWRNQASFIYQNY
ncbi:hypothetical protein RhiirA4_483993 [Rhizophagus irregularis]|uniref:Uncharacterized protein n=1 Tax=Rhizophagus irregularis TaxID=588596 RepID=A0A2I1HNB7_9GLOM|nr:hypothetical protein RhiirA4_483993 [Rhizophagus irregularis]